MRALGVMLGTVLGISALAGIIWAARYAPWVEQTQPNLPIVGRPAPSAPPEAKSPPPPSEEKKAGPKRPAVAEKGPFPKVSTGERVFEFGSMGVDEEKKHKFAIQNKGETPLDLEVGPSTCKCTVGSLSKKKVMPGESVDVELAWRPKEVSLNFAQNATIWTNDPDAPDVVFKVYGKVAEKYVVVPAKGWHAGHVTDVQESGLHARAISNQVGGIFQPARESDLRSAGRGHVDEPSRKSRL
jgi:hypothetical protein